MAPDSPRTLADAGDLDGLVVALQRRRLTPRELRPLLRHADARVVQATLIALLAEVPRTADADALAAFAAALPADLAALAPEAHAPCAALHAELARWGARLPDWRAADLPAVLALPWLTASLLAAPRRAVAAEGVTERLLQALTEVSGARCLDPLGLVDALLDQADARTSPIALRVLQEGVRAGAVPGAGVGERLCRLVAAGNPEALAALSAPWARGVALPRPAVVEALADPARAAVAVSVVASREDAALLWAVARGAVPGPAVAALAALGDVATEASALLDVADADPLAFGAALRTALVAAHQRGVFLQASDLPRLLAHFGRHQGWPPAELAGLCHPVRDALVAEIARLPVDDARWPRALGVLAASESSHAPALVRRLLAHSPAPAVERAALEAVATLEDVEAEGLVVEALSRQPPEALAALRRVGGAVAARALRGLLGIEPAGDVAPWLLPHLQPAVALLWQLCPPRSPQREEVLGRLNPSDLPPAISADVAAERSGAARRLALNAAVYLRADQALVQVAALAEEGTYDTLYGLLRQTVVGLHDGTVPGDAPLGTEHTRGRPHIPVAVIDALLACGRALAARGRIRPVCVVRAPDPGHGLLAEMAIDLARFGGLEPPMQVCLLAAVEPLRAPGVVRRVHGLLRHRDAEVRAAAIRILVAQEAEDASARALAFSLVRLLREEDPQTLRPALEAVARFGLRSATALVARALEHPNMNIKKTAAEALVALDVAAVIDRVVGWLGRHDNPGFRERLNRAYDASRLGPGPLLAALDGADDRTTGLLIEALDGRLGAGHVRRLLLAGHPAGDRILAAVAAGELRLREADLAVLRVELARYRLPAAERLPTPARPPAIEALERHGFDPDAARDALTDAAARRFVPALVRRSPREWLALLPALEGPARLALAKTLGEVRDGEAIWAALADLLALLAEVAADADAVESLLDLLGRVGGSRPGAAAGRVIDALRALPATPAGRGQQRWQVLKRLGAAPGRADLDRSLADCDRTADPVGNARTLLCQAFQVSAPARDLPPALLEAMRSPAPDALAALAARPVRDPGGRISALIAAWPHGRPERQAQALDVAEALQPLGTPRWIKGLASPPARPRPRPEGAPRLAELLADLADPARRREAAVALLDWPDVPEAHVAVLEAWLASSLEVPVDRQWLLADLLVAEPARLTNARGLELVEWLPLPRRRLLLDRLWALWLAGLDGAEASLKRLGAGFLLPRVAEEVARGGLMAARLLSHGALPSGPLLDGVLRALRAGGQDRLADELAQRARPGPLGTPAPPPTPTLPAAEPGPDREALVAAARGADGASARAALDALIKEPDAEIIDLLIELTQHRDPARRILALRCLKRCAPREVYLDAAVPFLDDPRPDVQRSVIRALAHARHPGALRGIVELLQHRQRSVRQAAADGLELYGDDALSTLRRAHRRARPDRREAFGRVIEAIQQQAPGPPPTHPPEAPAADD
ncbi:MAG: HEAT repeat domain-containing protein [Myxococcales bacterium]|nr:HEAT repeat domain-containing protein [Myxococcales bacterium]